MKFHITQGDVTWDVDAKPSDLVRLEEHDPTYQSEAVAGDHLSFTLRRRWLLGWIAATRAARTGLLTNDLDKLCARFEDFLDFVDAVTCTED